MAGSDPLSLRLRSITWHTEQISSYEFVDASGGPLPSFTAGAHINLELPLGTRSYSISNAPSDADRYILGIAKEPSGRGGSRYVHDQLRPGAVVAASSPRNLFPLADGAGPHLLFAGGIGITPLLSMAMHLEQSGASWQLVYAFRDEGRFAFRQELQRFGDRVRLHDASKLGYLDLKSLVHSAADGTHFYCCGPSAMLSSFEQACAGRPEECVHLERFAASELPQMSGGSFEVVLAKAGATVTVREDQTILAALTEAGFAVPSSCGQGICGVCETSVLSGLPDHRDGLLSTEERAGNKVMMICCSRSRSPSLILDI